MGKLLADDICSELLDDTVLRQLLRNKQFGKYPEGQFFCCSEIEMT